MNFDYDVIIIGAGHAGCEAALASSRLGCSTVVFTMNIDTIALMACNPAIGGPAKGQIVGEIDALGGEMGTASDATFIQMKVLNRSRGPAIQCLRSQNDKRDYTQYMRRTLELQDNLDLKQATIDELLFDNNKIVEVVTDLGKIYKAKTVVLTPGTFLKGKVHFGLTSYSAGRIGEFSCEKISDCLEKHFRLGRLKTGTPPRLDSRTIDYTKMTLQPGDNEFLHFSFRTAPDDRYKNQVSCYLTRTTTETHKVILDNLDRSPLYNKKIEGLGPRYCPSIEDKVVRFSDKDSHQIFIEPEGRETNEIYAQGLNTSLPEDVQEKLLKTMPGLENVEVMKSGYAIEYDFVFPDQLLPTLETKKIKGLFFAGQINGTSGYEEAAGQGLVAGINAALHAQNKPPFTLKREESYIGTLIDDLISKEIKEPYRMFTSRSEYRIVLRQDNAIFRLSQKGYDLGLLNEKDIAIINLKREQISTYLNSWKKTNTNDLLVKRYKLKQRTSIFNLAKRPEINIIDLIDAGIICDEEIELASYAITEIKYEGYIARQQLEIEKILKYENKPLPLDFDYKKIPGLKVESMEKLNSYKPGTIYDARKIAGINPADILILLGYFERLGK